MTKEKLRLNLCVVADPRGWEAQDAPDGEMWSLELVGSESARTLEVIVARVAKPGRNLIPQTSFWDVQDGFGTCSQTGKVSYIKGKESDFSDAIFSANFLSVAVKRAAAVVFSDFMGEVSLAIEIRPYVGSKRGLVFDTLMTLDFSDPTTFGRDTVFSTLDAAAIDVDVNIDSAGTKTPEVSLPSFAEGSEIEGDVRGAKRGEEVDYPQLTPHSALSFSGDAAENNAELYHSTAPQDKYHALAEIVSRLKVDGDVLIVGDNPGTLGRALTSLGHCVVGIDPKNANTVIEGVGRTGRRRCVRDSIGVGDTDNEYVNTEWGAVVVDTGIDGEAADVATARNLAISRLFVGVGARTFVQTRSAPLADSDLCYFMLPGSSRVGCEGYAWVDKVHPDARELVARMAWMGTETRDGNITVSVCDRVREHPIFKCYFSPTPGAGPPGNGVRYGVDSDSWYALFATRHFIEASDYRERSLFDHHVHGARNGMDLLTRLSLSLEASEKESTDLRSLFERGRVCDVVGVPGGAFHRSESMASVVAARYKHLLSFCAHAEPGGSALIRGVMLDARSGALLRDLSTLRAVLGVDLELAKYCRVLPYQHMSILASNSFFKAVCHYAASLGAIVGRPMHAWELQYLLWSLTHFGTRAEKIKYIYVKLKDCAYRGGTGRRANVPSLGDQAVRTFINKLDDLVLREAYARADAGFSAGVAGTVIMGRKREGPGTVPPPSGRRHSASTSYAASSQGYAPARPQQQHRPFAFRG
ncbi:hypothetical protein [Dactylonectria torresensis alternavirus 1]|nr:hypothetical protein [Dactylonectria torresensis alternavirus 1]